METSQLHRKFLKTPPPYEIGEFLPEQAELFPGAGPIDFHPLIHARTGSILFFMSPSCTACNYEAVAQFTELHPQFDYRLFVEATEEAYRSYIDEHEPVFPAYRVSFPRLELHLKVVQVPFVLVVNNVGQVVSADIFNDLERLTLAATPLLNVFPDQAAVS